MAINNPGGGGGKGKYSGEDVKAAASVAESMKKISEAANKLPENFRMQSEFLAGMVDAMKQLASDTGSKNMASVSDSLKAMTESVNAMDVKKLELLSQFGTSSQAAIAALNVSIGQLAANIEKISPKPVNNLNKKMQEASDKAKKAKKEYTGFGHYLKEEFAVAVGAATGAVSGLVAGFKNSFALIKSGIGIVGQLASSMFEIGKSILAIPFKLFNGLIDMAHKGGNEVSEFAQAINEIRKQFGSLKEPLSKTIISGAREMKGFAATGLNAFQVFGNVAERMQLLTALFNAGGPALRNLYREVNENTGAIMGYQRGLGLTDEQMGQVALKAQTMGKSMSKILNNITKQSLGLGKAFDVDAKIISKGMAQAMQNVRAFGNTSEKSIGVAVTYAHKLGIDLDKITGSLESFATFDQAADNVSKLNEAFGTNIDAAEMMNAESPADQMEIVRKAFRAAGVEGEKLSRAQRSLIQQTTGWDDATAMAAFSTKNYNVSLDKMKKQSKDADRATMSQAEAMSKLADAMERNLKAGQEFQGGFLDVFLKGFADGIQSTQEFKEMMMAIKKAFAAVYREGIRLGKAFVEMFPGIKDLFTSIKDFFNAEKFKTLAAGVTDVFIQFFKNLQDPKSKASFSWLMSELKKKFFSFFDSQNPAGKKMLESFKKVFTAIRTIVAEGIRWVGETLVEGLKFLGEFIKNPAAAMGGSGGQASELMQFFQPIIEAILEVSPKIWDALVDIFSIAFDKLKSWFMDTAYPMIQPHLTKLLMVLFGPAFIRGVLGGLGGALTAGFGKIAGKMFDNFLDKKMGKVATAAQGVVDAQQQAAAAAPGSPGGPAGGALAGANKAIPDKDSLDELGKKSESKINFRDVLKLLAGLAMVIAIGIVAFVVAVMAIRQFGIQPQEIIEAGALLMMMAMTVVMLAGAMWLISKAPDTDYGKTLKALLGIGLVATALGVFGVIISALASLVSMDSIIKAGILMGIMSLTALAVGGIVVGLILVGGIVQGPQAAAIVTGLIAIGVVMAALALFGFGLVTAVDAMGFSKDQILNAGLLMEVAGKAVGYAAAAAFAAIAIGWSVIVSGVPAALIGFAVLDKMLTKMTETADIIIASANKIPNGSEKKAEVLVNILGAIVETLGVIPKILEGMDLKWWESSENQRMKMMRVTDMIKAIFGSSKADASGRENSGLVGLINEITASITAISQDKIKSAEALGPIISAAAQLISALTGPIVEIQKNTSTSWFAFSSVDNAQMQEMMDKFKEVLMGKPGETDTSKKGIMGATGSLIKDIIGTMNTLNLSNLDVEKTKAIAPLMQSAFEMMGNIISSIASATKNMQTNIKTNGTDIKTVNVEAIKTMGSSISTILKDLGEKNVVGQLMNGIIKATTGTTIKKVSPEMIEKAKKLFGIVSVITELVNAARSNFKESTTEYIASDKIVGYYDQKITKGSETVGELIQMLAESGIGKLANTLVQHVKNIRDEKFDDKDVKKFVDLFGTISKVSQAINSINAIPVKEGQSKSEALTESLQAIDMILGEIFNCGPVGPRQSYILDTISKAAAEAKKVPNLSADVNDVLSVVQNIEKLGKAINAIFNTTDGKTFNDMNQDLVAGLGSILGNLSHGPFKDNLFGLKKNVPVDQETITHIGTIEKYLLKVAELTGYLAGIGGATKSLVDSDQFKGLTDSIASIVTTLKTFVDKTVSFVEIIPKVIQVFGSMTALLDSISSFSKNPNFKPQTVTANMKSITASVTSTRVEMGNFINEFLKVPEEVKRLTEDEIQKTIEAVGQILNAASAIENSLAAGQTIDIDSKLKVFGAKFGKMLGSSGKYTVKTKDVNVTVNLRVAMDATELENVMVSNKESVIANRINMLLAAVADDKNLYDKVTEGKKDDPSPQKPEQKGIPGKILDLAGEAIKESLQSESARAKSNAKKKEFRIHRDVPKQRLDTRFRPD